MIARRLNLTVFIAALLIHVSSLTYGVENTKDESTQSNALPDKINALTQKLKTDAIIHGKFIQRRFVKDLQQPLSSSGHFIYWRDKGIYWQTDIPFPQAITYSTKRTTHWKALGVPLKSKKNSRREKHFRNVLLSLFSFDIELLEKKFTTHWEISDQEWQLELTPAGNLTRRALDNAQLFGDTYIQNIALTTSQGDKLDITFDEIGPLEKITHQQCVNLFGFSVNDCNDLVGNAQ